MLLSVRHMERGGVVCFSAAGPLTEAILNDGSQIFENAVQMPDAEAVGPWRWGVYSGDGKMYEEDDTDVNLQLDLIMVRNVDGAVANLTRDQPREACEWDRDGNDQVALFDWSEAANLSWWIHRDGEGDMLMFAGALWGDECYNGVTRHTPWRSFHLRCHVMHYAVDHDDFYFESADAVAHALACDAALGDVSM